MSNVVNRVRSGLRRVGDWVTGRDVEVATGPPPSEHLVSRDAARPLVDVLESDDELVLRADVPGAHPDSTQVHVDGGRLTVFARAGRHAEGRLLFGRGTATDWRADFAIPEIVDADRIDAALRDGVLTIRMGKRPAAAPRRVAVTIR